jgi:hypothetical protein
MLTADKITKVAKTTETRPARPRPKDKTHDGFRYTISPMANHRKPVRDDEEYQLLAISEARRFDESAATNALSHPRHSLVYSEYKRLLDAFRATKVGEHSGHTITG